MKLVFFLIAFCLISIRYFLSWAGKEGERSGVSVSNMVVKTDSSYEEIDYSGKFRLSDDETSFKSISPGGYFKYRFNEIKVKAETNLQGEIEYTIYNGKNDLPANAEGKIYVSQAIREMIDWGYDAEARMERVYQKGGTAALFKELDSIKAGNIRVLYLNRLIQLDSGSGQDMSLIIKKIGRLDNDMDKVRILEKLSATQFNDSATNHAYFEAISSLGSDIDKVNALEKIIRMDSLSKKNVENILAVSQTLGSDGDRANLYQHLINRGMTSGNLLDILLTQVNKMGSEMDKTDVVSHLLEIRDMSDSQWILLLTQISSMNSDMDKARLLVQAAPELPKNEAVRVAYRKAARTIGNDQDYGKVMRAVE